MNNTTINQKYLLRIFSKVNKLNNVPTQERPVFIIKYGPPASGKGSRGVKSVIESFGHPLNSYIDINVDDVVESLNTFKKDSRKILNAKGLTTAEQINQILNKATNKNAENFSKPYFTTRFNKRLAIPNQMDLLMKNAIIARKNISFETTGGTGFPSWIFDVFKEGLKNYDIKFIFPLVDCSEGWSRYKRRPTNSYLRGGVFRFGSSKKQYIQQYIKSYNEFLNGEIAMRSGKYGGVGKNARYFVIPRTGTGLISNSSKYRPVVRMLIGEAKSWGKSQGIQL